jgi:hypothetical protein
MASPPDKSCVRSLSFRPEGCKASLTPLSFRPEAAGRSGEISPRTSRVLRLWTDPSSRMIPDQIDSPLSRTTDTSNSGPDFSTPLRSARNDKRRDATLLRKHRIQHRPSPRPAALRLPPGCSHLPALGREPRRVSFDVTYANNSLVTSILWEISL